jgi:replicative DNA helicase
MKVDMRPELAAELLRRGGKRKANGNIEFRCLRHDDGKSSAWLGDHAHGCLACDFTEPLHTLAEELGIAVSNDYTVEDYAREKGFSVEKLAEWGVETQEVNGDKVVAIPYFNDRGELLRYKFRAANKQMFWDKGRDRGLQLYGLERLNGKKSVLLVEGESDTHAAWHHGVPVLGVPGANAWQRQWAQYVEGKDVYIWQEPDKGGETFVKSVSRDVPHAKVIVATDVKDLADLHQKLGTGFKAELQRLAAEAVPASAPKLNVQFDVMLGQNLRALLDRKLRPIEAVPTPFPSWNAMCRGEGGGRGLARGWHVLAAAGSGKGKSILGVNLAHHAAKDGERVTYITLEMSQPEVQTRLLAVMSGVPIRMLEQGRYFDAEAFKEASRRVEEIHEDTKGCVAINRLPLRSLRDIQDSIRYNYEVHGSRYFIVDYLQLAQVGRAVDIYTRVTEISDGVRALVKELQVCEVGMSQFNRETTKTVQTKDGPKVERPTKEGLLGGASLEQDADQVILLHTEISTPDEMLMVGILDKNRHGPQGDIPLRFRKDNLRMEERLPDEVGYYTVG